MPIKSNAPAKEKTPDNFGNNSSERRTSFLPNILDAVDSATYNFKLYMTSLENSASGEVFRKKEQIVIAESGVTADIEIKDVRIKSIVGFNSETNTGASTTLEFTLVEPNAISLIDRIHGFAKQLDVKNYMKIPYYLQLSFKGRNASTSVHDSDVSSRKWVWPILISKMDINVTSSGTVYTCSAVIYSDLAYTNEFGSINQNTAITAETVDDFLVALKARLEHEQFNERAYIQDIQDRWEFVVSDEVKNSKILSDNSDENSSVASSFTEGEDGTTIQFNDGTDIIRALDSVLTNTVFFQKKIKNTPTSEGDPEEAKDASNEVFHQLYRIYTDTTIIGYDERRGDFARKFTYTVKEYDIGTLIGDIPKGNESNTTLSVNRINSFIDKKYLKKRYDYIFTGLNDQVIDIDMKFNTLWYAARPREAGNATTETSNVHNSAKIPFYLEQKKKENKKIQQGAGPLRANVSAPPKRGNYTSDTPDSILPLSLNVSEHNQDMAFGVESHNNDGKNILSSMFNQLLSADMLMCDITIKGDPYWLEPAPYTRASTRLRSKADEIEFFRENKDVDVMFDKNGQMYILFIAKYPATEQIYGDRTTFEQGQMISGLYSVITIEHTFADGRFTQVLKCARDKITDINLIKNLGNL